MMPDSKIKILVLKKETQDRNTWLSKYISHWHDSMTSSISVPLVVSTSKY